MVTSHAENLLPSVGSSELVCFAGDDVRLAGQIDYPLGTAPAAGFPLIFIIQHATCNSRREYEHITKLGTEMNAAVFRWDKRGTGASGAGCTGSVTVDTLRAYQTAVTHPHINPAQVVIFAQNEGTMLLGEAFRQFRQIHKPCGVLLAGNMLDEKAVLALDVPLHIVVSRNDWNAWQIYAEAAADAHAERYRMVPSFYVATNANRRLMYTHGGTFHRGAEASIKHWLSQICQIS